MTQAAQVFFRPKPERRVIDPHTHTPLPAEGAYVHYTEHATYWERRLQDGDAELVLPQPLQPNTEPAEAAAEAPVQKPGKASVKLVQQAPKEPA